jgi:DNA repair protein RecO (recombination protein O)
MLITTQGIVLRNVKYGDHSHIVTIYSDTHGLISVSYRPGRSKGRALLAPLSIVHLTTDIRSGKTIYPVKELSMACQYASIPFSPGKASVLMFLNELFVKVLKEEAGNQQLFDFLTKALKELDHQHPLHPSFHLSVMLYMSMYLGFFPHETEWHHGLVFDLREGVFVTSHFEHPDLADEETSRWLFEFLAIPFDQYQYFTVGREGRNRLLNLLIDYYRLHVAGFGEMKSVEILRSLYD